MKPLMLAAALMLAGCATQPAPYQLRATSSNGQDLRNLGVSPQIILESRQPGGIVSVRQSSQLEDYGASFIVAVKNVGAGAIPFGPENVAASIGGKPVAVLSEDQLGEKVRGSVRAYMRATDRYDPTRTRPVEAGRPDVAREYTFNNYGGCPAGQGRCQIEAPDGGSVYRQDRIDRELNLKSSLAAAEVLQRDLGVIGASSLKSTPVPPGAVAGGLVVIEAPRPGDTLDLVITFAGQPHRFSFEARPTA